MKILIQNGLVVNPAAGTETIQDVFIADGKIIGLAHTPDGFLADRTIDAKGLVLAPGLIDLAADLREPGLEHKGTIQSETMAAAAGGITTLCCQPTTHPTIDNAAMAVFIQERANNLGKTKVLPIGALTQDLRGEYLAPMGGLQAAGCLAVSNAHHPIINTQVLQHSFAYAATLGLTIFINAQDYWLSRDGLIHEGIVSARLGLPSIPTSAETIDVARCIALMEETGAKIHFNKLSSAASVAMVDAAKARGLPVSADVAVPHLFLTELDLYDFNSQCFVFPPFRSFTDRQALRSALCSNSLDAICSAHQPHEADAKLAPLGACQPGISGLDTLLSLTLKFAQEQKISLHQALAKVTCGPAKVLGIDRGSIYIGAAADLCIFNAQEYQILTPAMMHSAGKNSPFLGWELPGKMYYTILNGEIVFEKSELVTGQS